MKKIVFLLLGAVFIVGCGTTFEERQAIYRQRFRDAITVLTNGTVTNVIGTVRSLEQK